MDELDKSVVRGRRSINGKTTKKFEPHKFDDAKEVERKAAGKRGHSRIHEEEEIYIDEDEQYADLIDLRKIK